MCPKYSTRAISALPIKLVKVTVILVFLCFAECAAGSCMSYGHACWGAHGKRNGARNNILGISSANREIDPSRWYLSRLLQSPLDLRYLRPNDLESPSSQRTTDRQLFSNNDMETEILKGQEEMQNSEELFPDEENPQYNEIITLPRPHFRKMKRSQLFDKSSRMN